ncbi:hypothetical protein [Bacillus sp. J33]|uniref:hypothetical protein n=1 Tax=Bacillus sp. J33 TaxID=935836 RepID=UPI0004AC9477|nr:hypothetical protein [Bacillus sp. J33]
MKKYAAAAIAYLVLVMAGYTVYDTVLAEPDQEKREIEMENHEINEETEKHE